MTLEYDLQQLQKVTASSTLSYRIKNLTTELPSRNTGFNASLLAFRATVVGLILFLLSGMGTGVLWAAKGSSQGSVLFPLRQTLEKHNVPFFAPPVTGVPQHSVIRSGEEENEQENEGESVQATDSGKNIKHTIKEAGENESEIEESKKELENRILTPTQQVEGIHVGPKKEDD